MVSGRKLRIWWFALLALGGWLGGGCHTTSGPNPDSLASVVVPGHTLLETAHTVSEVFQKAGYEPVPQSESSGFRLVFELPGTATDTVLYGGWHENTVWYRAKIHLTAMGDEAVLLSCEAFRVLDHGDQHFETEHKLSGSKGARYQELLEQVRARLK